MKRIIISGLIAFGISVLCILPPILHFITAPLGPFIGGFVGGIRSRAKFQQAIFIGLVLGLSLSVLLLLVVNIIVSLQISVPEMMQKFVSSEKVIDMSLLKVALIPLCYGTALGTLGAWLGGKVVNKNIKE